MHCDGAGLCEESSTDHVAAFMLLVSQCLGFLVSQKDSPRHRKMHCHKAGVWAKSSTDHVVALMTKGIDLIFSQCHVLLVS